MPSGKQFYLYVLQTIDRSDAAIGGSAKPFAEEKKPSLKMQSGSYCIGTGESRFQNPNKSFTLHVSGVTKLETLKLET